jgi:hypothetical protein
MNKNNLFIEMLSNGGRVSSKRVVLFLGCLLFLITVLVELFTPLQVSENTQDALVYLIGISTAGVAAEKFGKKETVTTENQETNK